MTDTPTPRCDETESLVNSRDYNPWRLLAYRLERELTEARAESKWQPIETAPKDGTNILLRNECGSWIGRWLPEYVSGYKPSNPWSSMMLNHDHMGRAWNTVPSEWKPLDATREGK